MNDKSTQVNLEDLVPGMVLAEDAVHLNGRVLLRAGTCLTDKHLKVFRTWGLTEASIKSGRGEGPAASPRQDLDPAILRQAEAYMAQRFVLVNRDFAPAAELFRVNVHKYAQHLAAAGE